MKINFKLTLAFLFICLVPLIATSVFTYFSARDSLKYQVLDHLESVAKIQAHGAKGIVHRNLDRLALLTNRTQLLIDIDQYAAESEASVRKSLQEKVNRDLNAATLPIRDFEDLSILNLEGQIIASTDPAIIGANCAGATYFLKGLNENTFDIFFKDEIEGDIDVYLAGPLILNGNLIGVMRATADADGLVNLVEDYSGLGKTGETIMAARDENGDAIYITPLRFDPDAMLTRTVSQNETKSPITQALLQNEGLFTDSIDCRGKTVLAATQYIEETDWGLVAKIDKSEAFAPMDDLRNRLVIIVLVVSAVVIFIAFFISRMITKPIINLTKAATEISEGHLVNRADVVSGDEVGVLARAFNRMTDNLVEINATLEQKVEARTAELEEEIEERKRTEEARLHMASIVESSEDAIISETLDGIITSWNLGAERMYGYSADEVIGKNISVIVTPGIIDDIQQILEKVRNGKAVERYETIRAKKNGAQLHVSLTVSPVKDVSGKITGASTIARDITERKRDENRVHHLNAVLRAIRDVEELIVHEKDRESLIRGACDSLIKTRGYHNAWIALLNDNCGLEMAAEAGLGESFTPMLNQLNTGKLTACGEMALKQSDVVIINDPPSSCLDCPLSAKYDGRSAMTTRLEHGGNVYGLISVSVPAELTGEAQEQELFRAVASEIAFALHDMELGAARDQAEKALTVEREQLLSIFDGMDEVVYVSDPDSYEMLYMNERAKTQWGDGIGQKCHRVLQNLDSPCTFCSNDHILGENIGNSYIWEFQNNVNHRWYRCIDKAIRWPDGRMVRMEIAIDTTTSKEAEAQIQIYASQITQAYEEERKRIARELHDDTIQLLASLGMEIDLLTASSHKLSDDQIHSGLEEIRSKTDNLLTGLRHITQALRPPMLDELGLIFALQWLSDETNAQSGITTQFQVKGNERRLSPDRELLLFRIAQEALSNVRKHSEASEANVNLQFYPEKIVLSINDNGKGFKLPDQTRAGAFHAGGLGLIGMRERVKLLDGKLITDSELGKGTTIIVESPG